MKQSKSYVKILFTSLITFIVFLAACQKENSLEIPAGSQNLSIFLTDNPALFDKVLIDIRNLEVCVDTSDDYSNGRSDDDDDDDNSGRGSSDDDNDDDDNDVNDNYSCNWQNISIRAGVYDLLSLRNGIDTLLGTAQVTSRRIRKIRLTLGDNNTLIIDSISYPLRIPDLNQQSIVVKVSNDDIQFTGNGQGRIHIDFDAGRSIIFRDNSYFLYPQLKSFCDEKSARIEGRVSPVSAAPVTVTVYNSSDTSLAVPDRKDGKYKLRGLKEGRYSISFKGSNGYRDTVIHNISLTRGRELKFPEIRLHK